MADFFRRQEEARGRTRLLLVLFGMAVLVIIGLTYLLNGSAGPVAVASLVAFAAAAVTDAVKQWRFAPAMNHGVAVATKVSLPIRIVDDSVAGTR